MAAGTPMRGALLTRVEHHESEQAGLARCGSRARIHRVRALSKGTITEGAKVSDCVITGGLGGLGLHSVEYISAQSIASRAHLTKWHDRPWWSRTLRQAAIRRAAASLVALSCDVGNLSETTVVHHCAPVVALCSTLLYL